MLDIKGLTKCYGEKRAVDDLSLHIAPGTIYGFIGHSVADVNWLANYAGVYVQAKGTDSTSYATHFVDSARVQELKAAQPQTEE